MANDGKHGAERPVQQSNSGNNVTQVGAVGGDVTIHTTSKASNGLVMLAFAVVAVIAIAAVLKLTDGTTQIGVVQGKLEIDGNSQSEQNCYGENCTQIENNHGTINISPQKPDKE